MTGKGYSHVPSLNEPISQEPEFVALQRSNRMATLRSVLRFVSDNGSGATGLVELTEMLGLDEELLQLAGDQFRHQERHRRIRAALLELGLSVDELEDRDA